MADFQAFYLEPGARAKRRLFCVQHTPDGQVARAAVLLVPPLAEEMNKSRRMVALTARALAEAGCVVLRPDLSGCGDSEGEFEDANWDHWIDDVVACTEWLSSTTRAPLWLWGVRAGALLAAAATQRLDATASLLLWQPTPQGKNVLQAFIRMRLAATGGGKVEAERLRAEWAAGRVVDIAGYGVSPGLALGLDAASLAGPPRARQTVWLETTMDSEKALLPGSVRVVNAWLASGHTLRTEAVPGPAFWQTVEIETAPELVDATVRHVVETAT